jgi:hypothetical protein
MEKQTKGLVKAVGELILSAALGAVAGDLVYELSVKSTASINPEDYTQIDNRPDIQNAMNQMKYFAIGLGALSGCAVLARKYAN